MSICVRLVLFVVAVVWLPTSAYAVDICGTTETCEAPGERGCTCAARSAGSVYYYWRIPVTAHKRYTCTMESPFHVRALPDLSRTPEGVVLGWDSCCYFQPAVARINTQDMAQDAGDVIIKFEVGPSDIPTRVHIACDLDEES